MKSFVEACDVLMMQAAHENASKSALDSLLAETDMSEAQRAVFGKFWDKERGKVHNILLERGQWTPGLKHVAWRIDLKTQSKSTPDLNMPLAIVELGLHAQKNREAQTLAFEMDRADVNNVLAKLNQVQSLIESQT